MEALGINEGPAYRARDRTAVVFAQETLRVATTPPGSAVEFNHYSTPQMPAAAAAAVPANSAAAHQPCAAAAGSRWLQPGPHSQSCWSPDEEGGTWSRSVWCPTAAAAVGAWVSWSGRRGGREEMFLLVKLLCGQTLHSDGRQRACTFSQKWAERSSCTIALCLLRCITFNSPSHPRSSGGGIPALLPHVSLLHCITLYLNSRLHHCI